MDNAIKSVSKTADELRVANYIILFDGKDLEGEFFTKKTILDSSFTKSGVLHVDFEHGFDHEKTGMDKDEVLGYVDWKTAKADDKGVWVERVLNRSARYMAHIERLIDAGIMGNSSEAISGKAVRDRQTGEIKAWPLRRDTLTVQPMEPRMLTQNVLVAAKALLSEFPDSSALALLASSGTVAISERVEGLKTVNDFETFLREVGGLSKSHAVVAVAKAKQIFSGEPNKNAKALTEIQSILGSLTFERIDK